MVEPEILICNVCNKHITNFEFDLFHITAYIDHELNTHVHLCHKCFINNVESIPIIKGNKL